ncbi:MAG: GNAT family N-acetyltransferase [Rugosibacter sp.]|nr:hypothetical protein [Rugosibacter sp.]
MIIQRFDNVTALQAALPGPRGYADGHEKYNSFFHSLAWFDLLSQHALPQGKNVQWLLAKHGGSPILALPLMETAQGLASLANFYTPLFAPVLFDAQPALYAAALEAITHELRQGQQGKKRPAAIQLQPLDTADNFYPAMRQALRRAGYAVDDYFCFSNWYLPCHNLSRPISFADYFAARPSALRNTVQRARKKLHLAGNPAILIHTQPGAALDAAMDAFETIYQRSWKPDEAFPDFIRRLCGHAAERGVLRLGVLTLDGSAIASQIWLVDQGKACIFKLAYDPDAACYSPGSLLTTALMAHVLDNDKVNEIDYLSGDDAYKKDWMSHRRERRGLIAFDLATPRGLFAAARHFAGKKLRALKAATT